MNIVFIYLIVIVAVGLGGLLIYALIDARRSKYGKQITLLLREDNWAVDMLLEVFLGYCTNINIVKDGEIPRGWGVDSGNQVLDKRRSGYVQVCSERDSTPIRLFGEEPKEISTATIEALAAQVTDNEINYDLEKKRKPNQKWVGAVVIILVLLFCGMIVAKLKQNGVF
jgi:hypothetical protein